MEEKNINETGFFWRFYRKQFAMAGEEIEPPVNRCHFFLVAAEGFVGWVFEEMPLKRVWLTSIIAAFVCVASTSIFHHAQGIGYALAITSLIIAKLALMAALLIVTRRAIKKIEAKYPWAMLVIGGGACVTVITILYRSGELGNVWTETLKDTLPFLKLCGAIVVLMLMIALVLSILRSIYQKKNQ